MLSLAESWEWCMQFVLAVFILLWFTSAYRGDLRTLATFSCGSASWIKRCISAVVQVKRLESYLTYLQEYQNPMVTRAWPINTNFVGNNETVTDTIFLKSMRTYPCPQLHMPWQSSWPGFGLPKSNALVEICSIVWSITNADKKGDWLGFSPITGVSLLIFGVEDSTKRSPSLRPNSCINKCTSQAVQAHSFDVLLISWRETWFFLKTCAFHLIKASYHLVIVWRDLLCRNQDVRTKRSPSKASKPQHHIRYIIKHMSVLSHKHLADRTQDACLMSYADFCYMLSQALFP